jgi:hypothetical protein
VGQEVPARATWKRKSSEGRVQLETDYLLFRGDFRLKILFAEMHKVSAADGHLKIDSDQGAISIELGKRAETWAQKILHPPSVLDKLGIKGNQRISIVGRADDDFVDALESRSDLSVSRRPCKNSDQIFLFVDDGASASKVASLRSYLTPSGAVWIVYPKGRREFSENDVLDVGRRNGLKDVKVVKFSDRDTALKFVIPVEDR